MGEQQSIFFYTRAGVFFQCCRLPVCTVAEPAVEADVFFCGAWFRDSSAHVNPPSRTKAGEIFIEGKKKNSP
jgi:hypothetical protein